jgi:hypothetical protein
MQWNKIHFGQAHGLPFTVQPLDKLDWAASTPESEAIINGIIPVSIQHENPYVNRILQVIAKEPTLTEIDTHLTPDEVARGFRQWREQTSTSPSRCHLGLQQISAIPTNDKQLDKKHSNILGVQTAIINIPVAHGFAPE